MGIIPTIHVRRKADGHVCLINKNDFDGSLHEAIGLKPKAAEPISASVGAIISASKPASKVAKAAPVKKGKK